MKMVPNWDVKRHKPTMLKIPSNLKCKKVDDGHGGLG